MAFTVELQSGKYRFKAEPHSSILDAGIREGVPLNYGCNNGNCGLCKARIVKGNTKQMRRHDYVIPQAEKIQGYVLMCSTCCQGDVVIDADVADRVIDIPVQELRVKVRKIDRISDELAIISTQISRSARLRFIAGQYVQVYDDQGRSHDYAIASCPCDDKRIEFHVRKLEEDAFSNMVFENMKVGDWLNMKGPYGDFVINDQDNSPLIMVAFDTGFAAVKSLLEHITAQDSERSVYLYWLACGTEGLYLDNLCRAWSDALDQVHYIPIHLNRKINEVLDSEYEGISTMEEKLSKSLHHVAHIEHAEIFIVAPEPIYKLVQQLFMQNGFKQEYFHHEIIRGNPNLKCIHPHL